MELSGEIFKNKVNKGEHDEETHIIPKKERTYPLTRGRQAAVLIACMYMHLMSLGFTQFLGVVYVELVRYFDTQRSLAALVQSVYQGMINIGGIAFSFSVARFGVGVPTMMASVGGALSLIITVASVNINMVIVFIGLICGMAMSNNYLCAFVAVGWTFKTHRRSALGALTMATAVGQTVLPQIAESVISSYSWQSACLIASGLMLNALPCGLILHFSRKYYTKTDLNTQNAGVKVCTCSSKKDIAFILFVIACTLYPGTGAVEMWFIVDLTVLRGYGRQAGTDLSSLLGVFGLCGRFVGTMFMKLFPTISAALPMAVAFEFFGLGHFLVIYFTGYYEMIGGSVFRGIAIGCLWSLQPGMLLELRGLDRFPRAVAVCNLLSGIGQIISGYLGGEIADLTGGYDLAFYIATGVAVICGFFLVFVKCLLR
ncbi:monocarboxylate transporter 4-like [Mya arenaria]|uniref:monocarboxylate transporter 4-like n=1 Tax=Mya arenaria TaxID=6604 RepID=UPI0022E445B8|nr:monocarboxylate transporter 4-like [Mya arenaria]